MTTTIPCAHHHASSRELIHRHPSLADVVARALSMSMSHVTPHIAPRHAQAHTQST